MSTSKVAILLRKMSHTLAQARNTFKLPKRPARRTSKAHLDGARWLLCFAGSTMTGFASTPLLPPIGDEPFVRRIQERRPQSHDGHG
jgi:hypothetical protein